MNASDPSSSPSKSGSQALTRFSDIDSLFLRSNEREPIRSKPAAIPLERFQQLEQEIRHAPAVAAPYEDLAKIYLQRERWTDARRILDAGIINCPEHEPIRLMHEDLLLIQASQLVEEAKNQLAQRHTPENRYALEQAEINLINERIKVCSERHKRYPEQKDVLITWGIALRQSHRYSEAAEILREAATDLKLRARASLQLGMCLQLLDKPLEALSAFRRASLFRSPPPDPKVASMALELAAKLAEDLGLIDSAIYYLEELAARDPSVAEQTRQRIAELTPRLPPAA